MRKFTVTFSIKNYVYASSRINQQDIGFRRFKRILKVYPFVLFDNASIKENMHIGIEIGKINTVKIPPNSSRKIFVRKLSESIVSRDKEARIFILDDFLRVINVFEKDLNKIVNILLLGTFASKQNKKAIIRKIKALDIISNLEIEKSKSESELYAISASAAKQIGFNYIIVAREKVKFDGIEDYSKNNSNNLTIIEIFE